MTKIIYIEGNIGVGKTTLVNMLKMKEIQNCIFIDEPFYDEKELFDNYYADMKRWAMTFQIYIRHKRYEKLKKELNFNYDYIIMDRSPETDKNVFAKMLYDKHIMTDIEWKIYNTLNYNIINETKTIYLYCSPEIALNRIHKRNRLQESGITLEYLKEVENYHEKYINSLKNVMYIDCNKDFNNDDNLINKIINFI